MKTLLKKHLEHWRDPGYLSSILWGFLSIAVALAAQFFATGYANRSVSGSVTDIILSNTPVFNVEDLFIYGTVAFFAVIVALVLLYPRQLPFMLKAMAVFTLVRAVFISLTHIDIFPLHVTLDSVFFDHTIFRGIFTGRGLFFSGHTGLPYLLALVFWNKKYLRFFLLGFSVFLATVVLLGHIHYSIDVFSAFFITYTIYHIAKFLFPKDWRRSENLDYN